jgi:hypothetical protein
VKSNSHDVPPGHNPGAEKPLLLYAGSCPKCAFLSRCVVLLSGKTIRRVPLERPEWEKFYFVDYPQARGYPVLFIKGRPVFGARVFVAVPFLLIRTWINLILDPFKRSKTGKGANRENGTE